MAVTDTSRSTGAPAVYSTVTRSTTSDDDIAALPSPNRVVRTPASPETALYPRAAHGDRQESGSSHAQHGDPVVTAPYRFHIPRETFTPTHPTAPTATSRRASAPPARHAPSAATLKESRPGDSQEGATL
ncbi:hypothetical protein GCM10010432_28390 [Catellatospora methionotrophica]